MMSFINLYNILIRDYCRNNIKFYIIIIILMRIFLKSVKEKAIFHNFSLFKFKNILQKDDIIIFLRKTVTFFMIEITMK